MRILPYESAAVKVRVHYRPAKLGHFHAISSRRAGIHGLFRTHARSSTVLKRIQATVRTPSLLTTLPGDSAKFAQSPGPEYPIPMLSVFTGRLARSNGLVSGE